MNDKIIKKIFLIFGLTITFLIFLNIVSAGCVRLSRCASVYCENYCYSWGSTYPSSCYSGPWIGGDTVVDCYCTWNGLCKVDDDGGGDDGGCSLSAWVNTDNYQCATGDYSIRQRQQTRTESCDGASSRWVNSPCPVDMHCEDQGLCVNNCGDGLLDIDGSDGWSEECDSNTDACGNFGESCDANACTCSYLPASLTADVTPVCLNNTNSKVFHVSGTSEYCGDITITVDYGTSTDQFVFDTQTYEDYTFSHTFTLPNSISIPPPDPILIRVRGNRIDLQDVKDDPDPVYVCGQELTLIVGFQNFYYFPEPGRTFHPDYDIYISEDYYDFYNDGTLLDWDEKNSDVTIWTCADEATDCVDNSGQDVDAGSLMDADDDDEYELCRSLDGIQGGWLDLDVNPVTCLLLDGQFNRVTEWFECQPSNQCLYGVDDFAPDERGLCCGDDYGEIIHHTRSKLDTDTEYILDDGVPRTYDACCEEQGTHSCVDEKGICRQEGYDYCLGSGGVRATCVVTTPGGLGEWELTIEEDCISVCEICDVNDDGMVAHEDKTAISNNYNESTDQNNPYNVNGDTVVDIHDVEFCDPHIGEVCWGCGDNSLDSDEGCEYIDDNYQFNCPETTCDNNVKVTRDDNACTLLCTCEYTRSCDTSVCGGCEVDDDCSDGQVCNPNSCGCVDYVVGDEYSLHIYETDCSYRFCVSGDRNNAQPNVTIGTITTTTGFSVWGTENFEVNDIITLNTAEDVLSFESIVLNNEDCIVFDTDGAVIYDFTQGSQVPPLDNVYFEPSNTHPSAVPFEYSTPMSNECRECIETENPEVTLDDGIDNDCDGLPDEPPFRDEYSVYIWDSNCDYYLCAHARDGVDHETIGDISVENGYEFYNVDDINWESNDIYQLSSNNDDLSFRSLIYNDEDCLLFNADTLIEYDLNLNGSTDTDNIYLTQDTFNPYTNPFRYANPECSLTCTNPSDCGTDSDNGCDYEECIFDCGGYWVDTTNAVGDLLWPDSNIGDYCEECEDNLNCSNYENEPTCFYDPCGAAPTHFGCSWNEDEQSCEDALPECMPGTTLCEDGTCSDDCDDTDDGNQGCINDNNECDPGEGCACEDCEGEQDSCTVGTICGEDEICGCPEGTTLCMDLTCDDTCEDHGGIRGCIEEPNDECELGEGCGCIDCDGFQDSCVEGTVCNLYELECVEFNYGDCPPGTTLCNDLTCDETCEDNGGKRGCIGEPNDRCESGEGCACGDCHNKRDSCERGSVCNYDYELCEEQYSSGNGDDYEHCDDDDDDGYYEINEDCIGSDDCDDNNANVHPGALEICNNIDDDCDGKIDDNCIDQNFALDLSLDITKKLRILDKFQIKVKIRNNLDKDFSDLRVMLEVPSKFKVNQRSVKIDKINALETKEIYFDGLILDYNQETALFTLKAKFLDSDIITREIPVFIEIPDFLIAAEPRYDYSGVKCLDFYYAINQPGLYETIDIEFGVNNPSSFLGKSVLVDYISSVQPGGKIIVKPMISNPYCLPKGSYQTKGYLYKAGPFLVETIGESTEILTIS